MTLTLARGIATPQVPQELLLQLKIGLELLVAARHLRLRLELFDLRSELYADVGHAREIFPRIG